MTRQALKSKSQLPAVPQRLARQVVDLLVPPTCPVTLQPVAEAGHLSPQGWSQLRLLEAPWCQACGFPFEFALDAESLCAKCTIEAPVYQQARSAFAYTDGARAMILRFKHGGHADGLAFFLRQLQRVGQDWQADTDALIPVPLHATRLWARRYNQAAELARGLGRAWGVPMISGALYRVRPTASQGHKSRADRLANVKGAFAVRQTSKIHDKRLVLVDDVMTTGATVEACAATLLKAGARSVRVLTVARVLPSST